MKNNNLLNEKAIQSNDKKTIAIMWTLPIREYAVFNTKTGEQVTPFVNGENGIVEFSNLNPNIKYEVKTREVPSEEKPKIRIMWTIPLIDDKNEK